MSNGSLPMPSAMEEKMHQRRPSRPWTRAVHVPIPGVANRRLRIFVPNSTMGPLGRRRGPVLLCFACVAVIATVVLFSRGLAGSDWGEQWPTGSAVDPPTLVFRRDDLQRIWLWEIASGHYPTRKSIPKQIGLNFSPLNPALPNQPRKSVPSRYRPPPGVLTASTDTDSQGVGPKRVYLDIQSQPPNVAYPPRPVSGSVADMDVIMKHCDFSEGKYVRDCLEVLRLGAGLDNGMRVRRGNMDDWKYIYLEQNVTESSSEHHDDFPQPIPVRRPVAASASKEELDPNAGLSRKRGADWEPQVVLGPTLHHQASASLPEPCNPDNPRLFHMFWTGPFTDKPYLALLSFLFTQNTGIHHAEYPADSKVCRPQFWLWINPGPAAAVPNPSALRDMFNQLKSNPWASPFLHPRFKDVIKFKLWNTTEQLDGIPEIKAEWRVLQETLFNSGGHIINVPAKKKQEGADGANSTTTTKKDDDDMVNRLGSKSSSSYDRLSVILSDMARFVLCHRFGGIYLDADTIFLRDWEELWGWQGAFAYRWSRLKAYNTAVLRMNKNSALGTFLFRTALRNGLDFHPMTITRYMSDAHSEGLLLRLPDALFDSAWLNTEYYQRERPPQPYFWDFENFFGADPQNGAAPAALGFEGFFRGAFSYHFHNFWWRPFDPTRNWPDLGPRFIAGENIARIALLGENGQNASSSKKQTSQSLWEQDDVSKDKRDLDWSTVLKRTFESYIRGERPNMYGEWISW